MDTDAGKLFIGGISWETTEEKLQRYFSAYGEVVESVIMKDRATGRTRGFGFVVFADPLVADRVVRDKHRIDGRQVEAKKAVPRDEQQNAARSSNAGLVPVHQARTKKIFVGGLAATVTEQDFRKYFEQFGVITDVVVMYDHGTQRPRGFGFITYDSDDAVDTVLQTPFHELKGKMVEVKRAIPKEMSPSPTRSTGSGLTSVLRGGSPYGGGYGLSPLGPFGLRMDGRYSSSAAMGYSQYGPVGYGNNRNLVMNSAYGSPYGGGAMTFGRNTSPASSVNAGGIFGAGVSGYGSNTAGSFYGSVTPGRNPWSSGAGSGNSNLSGAGYGNSSLAGGNRYSGGSDMSGYGSGLGTWGPSQTSSNSSALSTAGVTYGGGEDLYSFSNVGYSGRGGSYWSGYPMGRASSESGSREAGYGDIYSTLGNQDTTWKSSDGRDTTNSASFGAFGGYGPGDKDEEDAMGGYSGRYTSGRQAH